MPRLLLAVAVPTWVVPSNTCSVLLASAVPVSCTLVVPLTIEAPVSTGAFGATVSIVTASAAEAELVVPETMVASRSNCDCHPPGVVVVRVHAPVLSAVAVPTCVVPSNTFTVLFAAAVPVKVSVLSLVMWSPTTPLSVENAGDRRRSGRSRRR